MTLLASHAPIAAQADFVPLFNEVDLSGWHVAGGDATFEVANGEIVGRSMPGTPNTFLVTNQAYSDFDLELEFTISDPAFNSGVQLRSSSLPEHNGGRLFGYQVEIDPSSRSWTGGLYFEGGTPDRSAGWLDDLDDDPTAQQAFDLAEWNHFRILARGRRIRTWINGVPASDYLDYDPDAFLSTGVIGLQVHSNPSTTPLEVRWRNILIDELETGPNLTLGDLNGDGTVDFDDYQMVVSNLHRDVSDLSSAEAYLLGDLTGDRLIDYADFLAVRSWYQASLAEGAPVPVPEPASALLVLASVLGAASFRRCVLSRQL
ncbi:family 16 glycoside hydrolase [Aeoliella sp.]|uniref:family 16 glycoside hydrolase n=1 Tax=Aeoliella sp. TaxID=2795800 RepID=UPI003CCC1A2D